MSVNTTNEYTVYLSTVHDAVETPGSATFTVSEVMFLLEMTYFQLWNSKVHMKIYTRVEEMLDDTGDIPMDEVGKKNIQQFRAQAKPTKFQAFQTNITGKKMPSYCGCPIHCVAFDGT